MRLLGALRLTLAVGPAAAAGDRIFTGQKLALASDAEAMSDPTLDRFLTPEGRLHTIPSKQPS